MKFLLKLNFVWLNALMHFHDILGKISSGYMLLRLLNIIASPSILFYRAHASYSYTVTR